jgi:hypothetical protein
MMMLASVVSNESGCVLQNAGPQRGPILMLRQAHYRSVCFNVVIALPSPRLDVNVICQIGGYTLKGSIIWTSTTSK